MALEDCGYYVRWLFEHMAYKDNFTGFWNSWKHGIVKRNCALLNGIHPERLRSAEEWVRKEDQLG